eukprot:6384089-Alexandrium_andersonii.AAC.1
MARRDSALFRHESWESLGARPRPPWPQHRASLGSHACLRARPARPPTLSADPSSVRLLRLRKGPFARLEVLS